MVILGHGASGKRLAALSVDQGYVEILIFVLELDTEVTTARWINPCVDLSLCRDICFKSFCC